MKYLSVFLLGIFSDPHELLFFFQQNILNCENCQNWFSFPLMQEIEKILACRNFEKLREEFWLHMKILWNVLGNILCKVKKNPTVHTMISCPWTFDLSSFLSDSMHVLIFSHTMQTYVSYNPHSYCFLYFSCMGLIPSMSLRLWIVPSLSLTRMVLSKFWFTTKFFQEIFTYSSVQCKPLHSFTFVLNWHHNNSFLSGLQFIFIGQGRYRSCSSKAPHGFTLKYLCIFACLNIILNNYFKSCQSNLHGALCNTKNPYKSIQINISECKETFSNTYNQLVTLSFIMCCAFSVSAFHVCICDKYLEINFAKKPEHSKKHQLKVWKKPPTCKYLC